MSDAKATNPDLFMGSESYTEVTLRDMFAAFAMAGLVNAVAIEGGMTDADVAREAYKSADAMLAQRERSK